MKDTMSAITDDMKHNFSVNLKKLMEDRGLTYMKLANAIGVSDALISNYVNEKRFPRSPYMAKLCQYFHVEPNYFLTDHAGEKVTSKNYIVLDRGANWAKLQEAIDDFSDEELEQLTRIARALKLSK